MLAKVLRVSSLPFLVTLEVWTILARLDLGIVSGGVVGGLGESVGFWDLGVEGFEEIHF